MMKKFYEQSVDELKNENLENLIFHYQKSDSCLINQVYILYEVFDKIDKNNLSNLETNLIKYKDQLISFTKMNTAFFFKYLNEENDRKKELIYTYVESSSLHISNLQNIYIGSLMFDINQFHNNVLHTKTKESIKQGELLLFNSKRSSKFAKITFWTALILSIFTFVISYWSNVKSEKILNESSVIITNIDLNQKNLRLENKSQIDSITEQNRILILKLDSILKKDKNAKTAKIQ